MQFNTRIAAAHWQEGPGEKYWKLVDEEGREYTTRFLVSCMGILTQPTLPNIPGVEDYKGVAHHTARWPKEGVSFDGKRVAVIGTGATGIQTIQEVVKTVGHLTVFQRTPNWTSPMHNAKIDEEEMDDIRRRYPEIFKACMDTPTCFIHRPNAKSTTDVTPEEREAFWEDLYAGRGFGIWLSNYKDVLRDPEANDLMSAFAAKKIRQRVKDPKTAEKLTPKNHGFGTRRLPLETNYLEAYNQSNVRLIDINEDPIEQITEKGIKTKNEDLEFDMIVYATGFDAVTGAFDAIDIRGTGGQSLRDLWEEGPKTYLGLTLHGFPNLGMPSTIIRILQKKIPLTTDLGMVMGPHQMFGNFPRSIEVSFVCTYLTKICTHRLLQYATVWITRLIQFCRDKGYTSFEATQQGMDDWTQHVYDGMKGFLSANVDSWMTGVNKNVARRQKRIVARYNGSAIEFRKFCEDVASSGYKTLVFDGDSQREQPREQPRL